MRVSKLLHQKLHQSPSFDWAFNDFDQINERFFAFLAFAVTYSDVPLDVALIWSYHERYLGSGSILVYQVHHVVRKITSRTNFDTIMTFVNFEIGVCFLNLISFLIFLYVGL